MGYYGWNDDDRLPDKKFLPECSACGWAIEDEEYFESDYGDIYCKECFIDEHKRNTGDYYREQKEEHDFIKRHGLPD